MHGLTAGQQRRIIENLDCARIAAKMTRVWLGWDERLAAAYYGLCRAARRWKPGFPSPFRPYAIKAAYREVEREGRRFMLTIGPRSKHPVRVLGDDMHDQIQHEDTERLEQIEWVGEMSGQLSAMQAQAIGHTLEGLNQSETARLMGLHHSTVQRSIGSAVRILRWKAGS